MKSVRMEMTFQIPFETISHWKAQDPVSLAALRPFSIYFLIQDWQRQVTKFVDGLGI